MKSSQDLYSSQFPSGIGKAFKGPSTSCPHWECFFLLSRWLSTISSGPQSCPFWGCSFPFPLPPPLFFFWEGLPLSCRRPILMLFWPPSSFPAKQAVMLLPLKTGFPRFLSYYHISPHTRYASNDCSKKKKKKHNVTKALVLTRSNNP